MENENLLYMFYEGCELGNHSRCLDSIEYKNNLRKMEDLVSQLMDNATDEQKQQIEELSNLCLDIINYSAPYDFENGFCTSVEFFKSIHERNVYVKTMSELRMKTREGYENKKE